MNHEDSSSRRAASIDIAAEVLSTGGGLRIRTRGLSMYPLIRHGDLIEVEPADASAVRLGDVILSRDGHDRIVGHRVVKVRGKGHGRTLMTKGDWTFRPDAPVEAGQVLGRIVAIERGGKRTALNSGGQRLVQLLTARISPHSRWLYLPLSACARVVQKLRLKIRNSAA
jgi:signal peptidase I